MNVAIARISFRTLLRWLDGDRVVVTGIPRGVLIRGIRESSSFGFLDVKIEHPDLTKVFPGAEIPVIEIQEVDPSAERMAEYESAEVGRKAIDRVWSDAIRALCAREDRAFREILEPGAAGPGSKHDVGKAPLRYLGLLRRSLELVASALEHGARAYGEAPGERNFEHVPDGSQRFRDALGRHVLADAAGEWLDADPNDPDATGLPHLVLAAVDALIAVELELKAAALFKNFAAENPAPSMPWASCSKACGFAGFEGNGCPCGGTFSERIEGLLFPKATP